MNAMEIPACLKKRPPARIATLCLILSAAVQAQAPSAVAPVGADAPEVVASGLGEVTEVPARAEFAIEIKTLAASAASASAENARLSRDVREALRTASIRPEEVTGTQLSVGANWSFDESAHRQKRTAYQAISSIQVRTEQLEKVSVYIDAALGAGATGVTTATYSAKDPGAMRRQALAEAVAAARRDAEAMAQAAGGSLGDLELVTTEQPESVFSERMDRMFKKSVPEEGTEIVVPKMTETARVIARWHFLSNAKVK